MKHITCKHGLPLGPLLVAGALALFSPEAAADEINGADTGWLMVATALVMLMTPAGLALFYGGMTSRKSVLNTIGMSYTAYCFATIAWIILGYTIAFGNDSNPYWGGLSKALMLGVDITDTVGTVPEILFAAFQGTFAAIAVAIVSGSIIERVRFSTWMIFTVMWVVLVYAPIAHFVWGGGFLSGHGELDFAGGTVVHINAGIAGLVLVFMIGKRKAQQKDAALPYSIKFTMLGSALLWFGWFGFNGGSALAADTIAANAIMVTNVAAAAGGATWLLTEWIRFRPRTLTGTASGVVAGLVGITPASGYVDVTGALAIGIMSGLSGYFAVHSLKKWLGYDDTLDAFGIHGIVGIVGSLATGLFANPAINGAAGAFYGNPGQLIPQFNAIVATVIYTALVTMVVFWVATKLTGGGRVSERHEEEGLDRSYHHEQDHLSAYVHAGSNKKTD